MKALVIDSPGQATVREIPYPQPLRDEVVIRVESAGLCGSDTHIFNGTYPAKYPLVPGHEFSGVIHKIGEGVQNWRVGQRVVVDPNIYCNECYYCLRNEHNMCENQQAVGVTRNGGFAEFVAVPVKNIYEIPDILSFDEGALVEPIACVVYALRRLKIEFGNKVIILGAGPMGLLMLKSVIHAGASEAVVFDINEFRLVAAKAIGATEVFTNLTEIKERYRRGFDIVIEATGSEDVIEKTFELAAKRARILQFGCSKSSIKLQFSPFEFYNNDWQYLGSRTYMFSFVPAISLLSSKTLGIEHIVNNYIDLEQLPAYLAGNKKLDTLKTIIKPQRVYDL